MVAGGWELGLGSRLLATGVQRGVQRLESGIWQPASSGWFPAFGGRLFDDGAGVVFGVVAEGYFGNVYTLTYWQ